MSGTIFTDQTISSGETLNLTGGWTLASSSIYGTVNVGAGALAIDNVDLLDGRVEVGAGGLVQGETVASFFTGTNPGLVVDEGGTAEQVTALNGLIIDAGDIVGLNLKNTNVTVSGTLTGLTCDPHSSFSYIYALPGSSITNSGSLHNLDLIMSPGSYLDNVTVGKGAGVGALEGNGVGVVMKNLTLASGGGAVLGAFDTIEGNIAFTGAGAVLGIAGTVAPNVPIIGFEPSVLGGGASEAGDYLFLSSLPYSSGNGATAVINSGTLTLKEDGVTMSFDIGSLSGDEVVLSGGANGTYVQTIPCIVAGTKIAVIEDGIRTEKMVEDLTTDDIVVTAIHGAQKIKWIGESRYNQKFIADNHMMEPVCIKAHALGGNLPSQDLWLSPGHALAFLVDGNMVLFQARHMINGTSVTQEARDVFYYHIELEEHDLLFTNGYPTESYLDIGDRAQFQNAPQPDTPEYKELYPADGMPPQPMRYPLVHRGMELQIVKDAINARAGIIKPPEKMGELRGYIDVRNGSALSGWAQDIAQPNAPVELWLMAGGEVVERTVANGWRDDLHKIGRENKPTDYAGNGYSGFEFTIPSGYTHEPLEVVRAVDGQKVPYTEEAVKLCDTEGFPLPIAPTYQKRPQGIQEARRYVVA